MPEMKRNFTKGKMNKDLDERLVSPGEYRDAMNIQVSTSEGSDVGTVQNILGNFPGCDYYDPTDNPILPGSYTVGSISDEQNDALYWLIAGPALSQFPLAVGETVSYKDMIMVHDGNRCAPVFVDKWKFCTGIDEAWNPTLSNSIILDDISLYDNIFVGMNVFGYSGTNWFF